MSIPLTPKHQQLIDLYAQMAAHTLPECRRCFMPHSCCDQHYCESTIKHAQAKWGVELSRTGHAKLPLMGPTGCTAAPHLRPMCSTHACIIQSIGAKPNDAEWTAEYYRLHEAIQLLEWELFPL
jgi:hypothetical protein